MNNKKTLKEIEVRIQIGKRAAQELKEMADDFPALSRNTVRLLACLKMLELNISDIIDLQ
jgi:hypothetical protein